MTDNQRNDSGTVILVIAGAMFSAPIWFSIFEALVVDENSRHWF